MNKVATFSKVSREQFVNDFVKEYYEDKDITAEIFETINAIYDCIELPKRATVGSAGYDISAPFGFDLAPGETIKFPTGIRCKIDQGWVLMIYVRSSIGFKYETVLVNGTGIIDSDYFNADNEGHIWVKLRNDSQSKTLTLAAGDRVCQGVLVPFGVTIDDACEDVRIEGIGSTGK